MSGININGNPEEKEDLEEEDDDDFGEFGGFETADPLGAAGGQACPSPWAAIASASAGTRRQPDLLCPQNIFPPYLDPSGISGSLLHAGLANSVADSAGPEGTPHLLESFHQPPEVVAERPFPANGGAPLADVLDGTFDSIAAHSRVAGAASFSANGMLPDIGLGTNQNPSLFAERAAAVNVSQNAQSVEEMAPVEAEMAADPAGSLDNQMLRDADVVARVEEGGGGGDDERQGSAAAAAVAEVVQVQQNRWQREMAALQSSSQSLRQQLERSQADLAEQRSRMQEVQQQHVEQLEAVRQSGHDALAVVVEEYKELSRTAVLEQQEASQRHLVEMMEQQLQLFQRALQTQREEEERKRDEFHKQMQGELAASLKTLCSEQQEQFELSLAEERRQQEEAIKRAVEEERCRCQQQVQEAIAAEQSKAAEQLQKVKEECMEQLETQRQQYEDTLREQCQRERDEAQDRLSACLEEEWMRGRETANRVLQDALRDREAYVQQQRQTDAALRRRQLASLDLFLESARRQIDLLLNPEAPPPDAAPHPPPAAEGDKNA